MSNFLEKINIERDIIKKTNVKFGSPFLNGLTFEAIDKWGCDNSNSTINYIVSLKKISNLLLSWADRSRIPIEEELNFSLVLQEIIILDSLVECI